MLAAIAYRIEAQVGVQAILGRDAWLHMSRVPFSACHFDCLMRRQREYARVPVKSAADALPRTDLGQEGVDHLAIGVPARLTLFVERLKAAHVRVHPRQPKLDDAVRQGGKNNIGLLDVATRQGRYVRAERHAHSNANETTAGTHVPGDSG